VLLLALAVDGLIVLIGRASPRGRGPARPSGVSYFGH
jgi:hypothetical protein